MARIVATIVLELVFSVLLALLLAGTWFVLIGSSPAEAFLAEAPRLVLLFMDIGIVTWLVLVIIGGVRRRGIGWGFGGTVLAALIGVVVNLVWVFILSIINGGADIFAIALGVQGGLFFFVSMIVVAFIVHRIVKPGAAPPVQS
jgi:hypothetical protein